MAKASFHLINALRKAADKISKGAAYQWGHMGSCNCGHLVQEITTMNKAQIHAIAMEKYGDWTEQVADFCPQSKLPMDVLISELLDAGLSLEDLKNLEKLSDKAVLHSLKGSQKYLRHNVRADVVLYMRTWAGLLEEQLLSEIALPASAFSRAEAALTL
jgi:hypothetical protein